VCRISLSSSVDPRGRLLSPFVAEFVDTGAGTPDVERDQSAAPPHHYGEIQDVEIRRGAGTRGTDARRSVTELNPCSCSSIAARRCVTIRNMRPTRVVFSLLLTFWFAACGSSVVRQATPVVELKPTVILVSFDGWRWDYHMNAPAPNLERLAGRGVRAEGLIPSFPAKTFPNHYTMVTGLYPGHHGIVANNIKDPATGRRFAMSKQEEVRDPMWWGGEPIWVTAQRAGQSGAAMFWAGSEAPIGGLLPRYWRPYDEEFPAPSRVEAVLRWLDLPTTERPTFVALYFEDTDTAGHDDGPDSDAVRVAIRRLDDYLGSLLRGLEERRVLDRVNVVVVSDHGMSAVTNDRVLVLDDYISLDDVEIVDLNPTLGLFPKPGREEAVFRALDHAHPHLRVYRRAETPEHWHYRKHPRIPPIVGVMDDGWQIMQRNSLQDILAQRVSSERGQHGYDPQETSMRGIFIAAGPAFKRGVTVPAFENVHIYNALAMALGVTPAANDGDPDVARRMLR
jgi:predicted AlkP superfamily pyrophosphatase or phosphodiesterase